MDTLVVVYDNETKQMSQIYVHRENTDQCTSRFDLIKEIEYEQNNGVLSGKIVVVNIIEDTYYIMK